MANCEGLKKKKSNLQLAMGVYGGWLWVFVVVSGGLQRFCCCLWWLGFIKRN